MRLLARLFAVLIFAWHLSLATSLIVRAFLP
jgi:hypothetical protein